MKLFGKSEPTLTKLARKISLAVETLAPDKKPLAVETIKYLTLAIRSLGNLTDEITETLFSVVLTLIRKSAMPGHDSEEMFSELKAGLSEELLTAIEKQARS